MSISERLYIRWLPDEPSEPTSTLVLTAPNRQFVDLRLTKSAGPSPPESFSALDWGIGGRSAGTSTHGEWIHDIDSRTLYPERDEGDTFPHPTLPDVTLEHGTMRRPESGERTAYEEAWRDVPILPVPGLDGTCTRVSVVLQLGAEGEGEGEGGRRRRGMICRVGQFCQGIVRDGDAVTVERWAWSDSGDAGGRWTRVARLGDLPMVCEATWAWGNQNLREGDTVHDDHGHAWVLKAASVW